MKEQFDTDSFQFTLNKKTKQKRIRFSIVLIFILKNRREIRIEIVDDCCEEKVI